MSTPDLRTEVERYLQLLEPSQASDPKFPTGTTASENKDIKMSSSERSALEKSDPERRHDHVQPEQRGSDRKDSKKTYMEKTPSEEAELEKADSEKTDPEIQPGLVQRKRKESEMTAFEGPDFGKRDSGNTDLEKAGPERRPGSLQRLHVYLTSDISTDHADLILLVGCFISGLIDGTIFNAYGTFISMQTGNTIILGLGGSTPYHTTEPYGWAKSMTAIACFTLGSGFFAHLSRYLGPLRRSTLLASYLFQAMMLLISAAIVEGGAVNGSLRTLTTNVDWWSELPIAFLSFQAAGQISSSRTLGYSEVPTVVVTSMLYDIASDPKLLYRLTTNAKRNRRVLAFFIILAGAVASGFIAQNTGRMQIPLWIAAGIKLGIVVAWMVWPMDKE